MTEIPWHCDSSLPLLNLPVVQPPCASDVAEIVQTGGHQGAVGELGRVAAFAVGFVCVT